MIKTFHINRKQVLAILTLLALFCLVGCQPATNQPLTIDKVEKTLNKHSQNWKPFDIDLDPKTAAQIVDHVYGFDDGDGLKLYVSALKEKGATHLSFSFFPQRFISGEEPEFIKEKLPDLIVSACALYDDGIDPKVFEGFWDFYEAKEGLRWRNVVGENILEVQLQKDVNTNYTTVTSVSIFKKSWADWSSTRAIMSMLWGDQTVAIQDHISTAADLTENKAVPIKSCYILNGDLVDIKKLTEIPSLPDEKEMLTNLKRTYPVPQDGEYQVATIEDASGKVEVIMPPLPLSESEFKENKYFVVYEYQTDQGKFFYLLTFTRALQIQL